jgi:hypothetical protein
VAGAVTSQAVPGPRGATALELLAQAGPSRIDGSEPAHLLMTLAANATVEQQRRATASHYSLLAVLLLVAMAVVAFDVVSVCAA